MRSNHSVKKPCLNRFVAFIALVLLVANPVYAAKRILVLGDSLSAGYGISSTEGWVYLLELQLASEIKDIQIYNASISGETTHGGLSRLPTLLESQKPDIVILELGANDALRGSSLAMTKDNLDKMIKLSQESGARVLLIGMHIPPNYGRRYANQFFSMYGELAELHQLPLVPFLLDGVATNHELMQADGLHPTAKAQPILLDNVLVALKPMLAPGAKS